MSRPHRRGDRGETKVDWEAGLYTSSYASDEEDKDSSISGGSRDIRAITSMALKRTRIERVPEKEPEYGISRSYRTSDHAMSQASENSLREGGSAYGRANTSSHGPRQVYAAPSEQDRRTEEHRLHILPAGMRVAPSEAYNSRSKTASPRNTCSESCENRLNYAQTQIADLQSECTRLAHEREQMETDVRNLQQQVFRRLEAADWKPLSNADIRRKLDQLDSSVKNWAKSYTGTNLHALKAAELPKAWARFKNNLQPFARLDYTYDFQCVPDDKGWLLVQAYLMHNIYFDVFDQPFFGVNFPKVKELAEVHAEVDVQEARTGESEKFSSDVQLSLQCLYYQIRECNVQEAVSWRVQTLRQLHPPTFDLDPFAETKKRMWGRTSKYRKMAVQTLISKYLASGISRLVPQREDPSVRDELATIISTAADLSYSLWTHKMHLSCQRLDQLGGVFKHDHGSMDTHQLHRKHVDDDPAYLDGLPIALISHPALVRFGNEDGTDFSVTTVLKKAICWMGTNVEGREIL